ncbi:hypothetical protein WA026_002195 [Henosepilachna vigintioctopunctata]|uniref:Uncharacterized protein n=1 Tax=Henosepilachna vigintioctopunctata TaxID=420089 RepID=A0AAW1TQN1_9CUCU
MNQTLNNFNRNFGSLREIYEAKTKGKLIDDLFTVLSSSEEEERLLTLEERHNRRQRQTVPPDVIPPPPRDMTPIYDLPKQPIRKILTSDNLADKPPLPPKNGKNRSTKILSTEKTSISLGIPDKPGDAQFLMLKNYDINNNQDPTLNFRQDNERHNFVLIPSQKQHNIESLKNLQSIIDNELKKNWIENELNNKIEIWIRF